VGTVESSMTKAAERVMRIADRCLQVMGGTGVSGDTIVEQLFREIRGFRIYEGPHRGAQMFARQEDQTRLRRNERPYRESPDLAVSVLQIRR
jgi:hypothetical protein